MVCPYQFNLKAGGFLLVPVNFVDFLPELWKPIVDLKLLESISTNIKGEFLPEARNVFRALELDPDAVKVLIIGQDPYPNPKHAMGLAFSVRREISVLPSSLRNIFTELENDLGYKRVNGDLTDWSEQGVLLLNRTLTVSPFQTGSHEKLNWHLFTEKIVKFLAQRDTIAVLWGNQAMTMGQFFKQENLITSAHPSPLSAYRGFFGSKPFSKVNSKLIAKGIAPIKW
jgi:uracil-DNA glycosylase